MPRTIDNYTPVAGSRRFDFPLIILWAAILFLFVCRGLPMTEALIGDSTNIRYSLPTVVLVGILACFTILSTIHAFLTRKQAAWPIYANYILALILMTIVSYLRTVVVGASDYTGSMFTEFLVSLTLVHLMYVAFDSEKRLRWLFRAIALAGIITSAFYVSGFAPSAEDLWRVGNLGAEGATYNTLAYNLAAALWVGPWVIVATRGIRAVGVRGLVYFLAATPLMIGGILLTGTKGAVLIVGLLCLLSEYIRLRQTRRLWQLIVNWRSLLTILVAGSVVAYMDESAPVQRAVVFERETWSSRGEILSAALLQLLETPTTFLLGQGIGMFSFIGSDNVEYTYPHNLFLDVALNLGIVAAVLVLLLLIRCFSICARLGWVNADTSEEIRLLALMNLGFGIVAVVAGLISFRFASNILLFMFISVAARLYSLAQERRHSHPAITLYAQSHGPEARDARVTQAVL